MFDPLLFKCLTPVFLLIPLSWNVLPIPTLPTKILHILEDLGEIQLLSLSTPRSLQLEMITTSLSYDLNSDCVAAPSALLDYKHFCSYHILLIFVIFYRTQKSVLHINDVQCECSFQGKKKKMVQVNRNKLLVISI